MSIQRSRTMGRDTAPRLSMPAKRIIASSHVFHSPRPRIRAGRSRRPLPISSAALRRWTGWSVAMSGSARPRWPLRAACVAPLAGKQVAVVAPTTVLVRQHLETFRRRFARFGIAVKQLSRLSGGAGAVRAGLADRSVQVDIGTHALASQGVRFADLGLVVIDEEQRFGRSRRSGCAGREGIAITFSEPGAARRRHSSETSASSDLHWRGDRLICSGVTAAPEERLQAVDALLTRLERSSR